MKLYRLLLLSLLLSGCSFSWLDMLPFMGSTSSSELQLSATGLGSITAQTAMEKQGLQQALGDGYHLQEGVGIYNNALSSSSRPSMTSNRRC